MRLAIKQNRITQENHRYVRPNLFEFFNKLIAAHGRHGEVCQNEINLLLGEEPDCLGAVGSGQNTVTMSFQNK